MQSTVLHISKYPPYRGGMDKVLRLHAATSNARLLHLLRPVTVNHQAPGPSIYAPMGWVGRQLAAVPAAAAPRVSCYYNCWGADVFSSADRAKVRVGYLHNFFPEFTRYVRHYAPFLDGFLTVSRPMAEAVQRAVGPEWRGNIGLVHYPVEKYFIPAAAPASGCVIGWCGRLARAQKRVDRLPDLLARLDETKLDYRLELLGDGPDRDWLAARIGPHPRVIFHGWIEHDKLVRVMQSWHYLVSCSDYEGQSIALLEAIATGCVPLYPDFHSGAELPPRTARACLYPPGDLATLIARLLALEAAPAEAAAVRAELANLSELHRPERYLTDFTAWSNAVQPVARRRPAAPLGCLVAPVWVYNRFYKRLTHVG